VAGVRLQITGCPPNAVGLVTKRKYEPQMDSDEHKSRGISIELICVHLRSSVVKNSQTLSIGPVAPDQALQ
jgi:hypothetical protein